MPELESLDVLPLVTECGLMLALAIMAFNRLFDSLPAVFAAIEPAWGRRAGTCCVSTSGFSFHMASKCIACFESQVLAEHEKQTVLESYSERTLIESGSTDFKSGSLRDLCDNPEMSFCIFSADDLQGRNVFA
jgi:hypothetical protein